MRLAVAALALALVLGGCGGGGKKDGEREIGDEQLDSARRNAALAFSQRRFEQAAQLYRQALERAQERDDGKAIGDLGYDLALSELRRGQDSAALAMAESTIGELGRRGLPVFAELRLVEATALYRLGRPPAARDAAAPVAAGQDDAARRARFLLGLIAADGSDLAALEAQIAGLGQPNGAEWRADRSELEGRAALLRGDQAAARAAFLLAADLRQETLDYPGMARVLAAAGAAAARAGDNRAAADLHLRAGRSLILGGVAEPVAERSLAEAERLARLAGDAAIIEAVGALRQRR